MLILFTSGSQHEGTEPLIAKTGRAQFFRKILNLPKMSQSVRNTPEVGFLKYLEHFIMNFYWKLEVMPMFFWNNIFFCKFHVWENLYS